MSENEDDGDDGTGDNAVVHEAPVDIKHELDIQLGDMKWVYFCFLYSLIHNIFSFIRFFHEGGVGAKVFKKISLDLHAVLDTPPASIWKAPTFFTIGWAYPRFAYFINTHSARCDVKSFVPNE